MSDEVLIRGLRRVSCLDNLRCLGCGYERSFSELFVRWRAFARQPEVTNA